MEYSPSEPPEGTNPANTLISDFQPPELRAPISVVIRHPVCGTPSRTHAMPEKSVWHSRRCVSTRTTPCSFGVRFYHRQWV